MIRRDKTYAPVRSPSIISVAKEILEQSEEHDYQSDVSDGQFRGFLKKPKGFFFGRHDQFEDVLLLSERLVFSQMVQRRFVFAFLAEGQRWAMNAVETNAVHIVLTPITSRRPERQA